ncbi:hypothetical protein CCR85_05225 [Rhodothalassium salexigens]|uniref:hypothetical protein n=1 Tax=Rhodothalassium salexigens TaxID=1086 RepID=UPI0019147329|nr:hypothetical protein [Rhodothalassium salexigens]MBK5910894.1 hypothetical protein [Rhodothalassium salexigens]MBK5920181.1 hypothetical protein [Rhodothalassium salexigens]
MIPDAAADFTAGHWQGTAGRLFAVQIGPADPGRRPVLLLPPFAEEMNCSRRFLATLARRLAAAGCCAFLLDYYGTGDSDGGFADATLDQWCRDIATAHDRLAAHFDGPPAWVGVRLGATLAARAAGDVALPPPALGLIQPLTAGRTFLTQFLRLGLVAAMAGGRREGPKELLARSVAGEIVQVAGYDLSPAMVAALQALTLPPAAPPTAPPAAAPPTGRAATPSAASTVYWYELVRGAAAEAPRRLRPPASWAHDAVAERVLEGEPFWSIQEPQVPADVLGAVCGDIAESGGARRGGA